MTSKRVAISALALLLAVVVAKALVFAEADMEKDEIKSLIEAAYINGAFNDLDTKTMRKGFHPVFKIHGVQDGSLREYPIDDWIAAIEKRKAAPDYKPEKWDHKFVLVDVTGVAAVAKIELFKGSEHVFTDYLSLLKFKDGWKITDKVYFRHTD
jgi:hypothetical protein